MDEQLLKILKKVYYKKKYIKDEKGYQTAVATGDLYDCKTRTTMYSTGNLSSKELLCLTKCGYPFNEITQGSHDETIHKLKEIIKHPNLSLDNLLSAYIAGFGSFPRGRQPILSYLFARAVPVHTFCNSHEGAVCEVCSLQKEFWLEKGKELFRNYWGYSWNERIAAFYLDLEEFSQLNPVVPTKDDLHIFYTVIDFIRNAPKDETVGKLEQRIKRSNIIPHCEKYRLQGQLISLAELGVIPNPFIPPLFDKFTDFMTQCDIGRKIPGSSRSDVVLPLAGWHGENGTGQRYLYGKCLSGQSLFLSDIFLANE